MTKEEKDFARLSKEVYKKPDERQTKLRGYTLLKDIHRPNKPPVPLNDKRWAVYRAPNGLDHVLVFRGTNDPADVFYDLDLCMSGCGKHEYIVEAAAWSFQVMLFLNGKERLSFWVAVHSLGGAVAISVILLLHDIPVTAKYTEDFETKMNLLPNLSITFNQKVADPWSAISKKGIGRPYELSGGHVFNPGAFSPLNDFLESLFLGVGRNTLVGAQAFGDIAMTGFLTGCTWIAMAMAAVASFFVSIFGLILLFVEHTYGRTDSRPDKGVTTHHIIGDLLSCSYRFGKEKSYMPKSKMAFLVFWWPFRNFKSWGPHSMENFV